MLEASVIIPTYNKRSRLVLTLWALRRQSVPCAQFEVIIVDDGSTDSTGDLLSSINFSNWHIINQTHRGRAAARNQGIRSANAKLLILLDDDILVGPEFVATHLAVQAGTGGVVASGTIWDLPYLRYMVDPQTGLTSDEDTSAHGLAAFGEMRLTISALETDFQQAIARQRPRPGQLQAASRQVLVKPTNPNMSWLACAGANLALPRSALDQVGMFDEGFGLNWGCEDLELGYRLCQGGLPIVAADAAIGYHMTHFRSAPFQEHALSHSFFFAKHPTTEVKLLQAFLDGRLATLEVYFAAIQAEHEAG